MPGPGPAGEAGLSCSITDSSIHLVIELHCQSSSAAPGCAYRQIGCAVQQEYAERRTISLRALEDKAVASIPIVAMTANAFAEEAGMNGHIAKPIDIEVMLRTITEVLSRQRRQ